MHRISAAALPMALGLSVVIAFYVVLTVDEGQPAGTENAFKILTVETSEKAAGVAALASAADGLGINIFKVQPDPSDSMQARILYAFVGDPDRFAAHGGYDYPTFSNQQVRTTVLPAAQITTEDLRGRYVTSADAGQLTDLLNTLDGAGLRAEADGVSRLLLIGFSAGQGNLAGAVLVMLIALALAVFYSVSRNRKIYALRALHGHRPVDNVRFEVGAATMTFGTGLLALLALIIPVLGFYNQFRQALRFLRVLAVMVVLLYLVLIVLVLIAMWSLPRMHIPAIIKGEQAARRNGILAAVVHVIVLTIVIVTSAGSMDRITAVRASLEVSDRWLQDSPLYALRVAPSETSYEDQVRAADGFGTTLSGLESTGEVLLVSYDSERLPDSTPDAGGVDDAASLIVNNEYLRRQEVRDPQGQRITDVTETPGAFTLLIPDTYRGDRDQLLARYTNYFADFACLVGRDEDDPFTCQPHGAVIATAAGQELFAYNGTEFLPAQMQHDPVTLTDPIIVVAPIASGLISPVLHMSYASQDDLFFGDPAALEAALREHGISSVFQGIDNATDAVATSRALSQRQLQRDIVSLALGWAALILATIIMAAVYCDRRKRPMFVQLIHGYSFTERHWGYFTAIVLLSLIAVGLADLAGSLGHSRDMVAAAAFVLVQATIAAVAIRAYESRFRADLIKRS